MDSADIERSDVVVIGAGSGLGLAFARACAARGARLWMIDGDPELLHDAVDQIVLLGGRVDFRVADLEDPDEVQDLVIDVRAKTPRLEVLFVAGASSTSADLVRGLAPGLVRGGASVLFTEGGQTVRDEILDAVGEPSVSVNALHLMGDATVDDPEGAAAFLFLAGLRGELRGLDFEIRRLARALSSHGEEYVRSNAASLAQPLSG